MKDRYFELYKFTNSIVFKLIRAVLFVISIILLYSRFTTHADIKSAVAILALVIINELFLESLHKIKPVKKVSENSDDSINSMIFPARDAIGGKSGYDIAHN